MSSVDFLAGLTVFSLVAGLFYMLIVDLLQLILFSYSLQFYCTSMGLLNVF